MHGPALYLSYKSDPLWIAMWMQVSLTTLKGESTIPCTDTGRPKKIFLFPFWDRRSALRFFGALGA